MKFKLLLIALTALFIFSCKNDTVEETKKPLSVPKFERDSAYQYLEKQLSFGPRVLNSQGHDDCRDWLVQQFKTFGARVVSQNFKAKVYTGESFDATNIIASYNPEKKNRLLFAAHWDTRHVADSPLNTERVEEPILGADDGGSGVAVLLEVARLLQANPVDIGIDIVLFDAEDYGESGGANTTWALGSQYWSRNLHRKATDFKYGILLDMVGAKGARFAKEEISRRAAPQLVEKVWKLAQNMGYGDYFVNVNSNALTDDHYFVNTIARIPMIDIVNQPASSETGFGAYWHTHDDNINAISKRTLRVSGQLVLAVIYREANGTF